MRGDREEGVGRWREVGDVIMSSLPVWPWSQLSPSWHSPAPAAQRVGHTGQMPVLRLCVLVVKGGKEWRLIGEEGKLVIHLIMPINFNQL